MSGNAGSIGSNLAVGASQVIRRNAADNGWEAADQPTTHTQNSDTYLAQGTGNEVTAANAKDAVDKKHSNTSDHSQNTDTALGSGCVAADHGTAATDMLVNVCYGTGDPPVANTTTKGTIYIKYTA